jgi:hypothetical protein
MSKRKAPSKKRPTDTKVGCPGQLRDWFAGQALAGLLANQLGDAAFSERGGTGVVPDTNTLHADYAWAAYDYADAMLSERKSRGAA